MTNPMLAELDEVVRLIKKGDEWNGMREGYDFLRTHHATLADMAKDAARYRWLRDKSNYAKKSAPAVVVHPMEPARSAMLSGEQLDAAIDAATQEGEG